jgi:hypothetical protein
MNLVAKTSIIFFSLALSFTLFMIITKNENIFFHFAYDSFIFKLKTATDGENTHLRFF